MTRSSSPDCHVQVDTRFYSIPWKYIGRVIDVRVGERVVRAYADGELIKTHVLERGNCADVAAVRLPARLGAVAQ